MLKGFPSVHLILTCRNEELVFEVFQLVGRALVNETLLGPRATLEKRVNIVTLLFVLEEDFLPLDEELPGAILRDTRLNMATLDISDYLSA